MFKKKKKIEDEKILEELTKLDEERSLKQKENFINILLEKDNTEDELNEYLTENELEELKKQKKEEKKLIIIMASTLSTILIGLIIFFLAFSYYIKTDLEKNVAPKMVEYYQTKYKSDVKVDDINYICKEKDCSKIILAHMSDNSYCVSLDEKNFYTDKNYVSKIEEAKTYINNLVGKNNVINTNLYLSYEDFHLDYNIYYDYVKVLPDQNINELIDTNKLEITGTILYQNEINIKALKNLLTKLGSNSKLYLIQKKYYNPYKLTILTKDKSLEFILKNPIIKTEGVSDFEIDKSYTGIEELTVSKINSSNMTFKELKTVKNSYVIKLDKEYVKKDEEPKPSYYFLKFDRSNISKNNLIFFKTTYGNIYNEMSILEIPEIIFSDNGEDVYVIGNSSIAFANEIKEDKKNYWCKLGLC